MKPFLLLAALIVVMMAIPRAGAADSGLKHPIGLQLYSLRGEFTKNALLTLDKVRDMGITNVELYGTFNFTPEKLRELLDERGLTAVSGHFPYDRFRTDPEGIAKDAATLGLKYAGCAWINHEGSFDEAKTREAIGVFNKAGEILAKQGIKAFYHCHGYEFAPHGDGTFMDLLIKETKPEWVTFEMDVFWVVHPGQDPVKWLEKYPGRWELMHVKDMKKGVTGNVSGRGNVDDNVVAGTGQMDWPAILRAAQKTGVTQFFIEDESAVSLDQIPQSLQYLKALKF